MQRQLSRKRGNQQIPKISTVRQHLSLSMDMMHITVTQQYLLIHKTLSHTAVMQKNTKQVGRGRNLHKLKPKSKISWQLNTRGMNLKNWSQRLRRNLIDYKHQKSIRQIYHTNLGLNKPGKLTSDRLGKCHSLHLMHHLIKLKYKTSKTHGCKEKTTYHYFPLETIESMQSMKCHGMTILLQFKKNQKSKRNKAH